MRFVDIPFSVTERAKNSLSEWITNSGMKEPVSGIVWVEDPDLEKEGWLVGLYERDKITDEFPGYFLRVSEIELFLPQGKYASDMLSGKVLDLVKGRYSVIEKK